MANWLWSIPPHNYDRCIDARTFAVRIAGRGALQKVKPGDTIFAYLPGLSIIAGVFRAASMPFESTDILWPDGVFPHRVHVEPVTLLRPEAGLPLDAFKNSLEVGQGYPNFGLVIQKVVHALSDADAAVLHRMISEQVGPEPTVEPAPPDLPPPPGPPPGESVYQELHRAQQKIGLLQRKVRDLQQLLALAGPNLEDYLRLAHSSQGVAFEEATRQCMTALGFILDTDVQGQSGEIDFVVISPFYIFGECQASSGQNTGVSIVDKLLRHRRRYLSQKKVIPPVDDCRVVVSEFATSQLADDAFSEGVTILRPSQLAALLKLKREYPGAVHPYNLREVLAEAGDATPHVVHFIDKTRQEIEKRVGIIEVLKNDRFKPESGVGSRDPGWIQGRVEIELETHIPLREIEDVLLELTSPLVGCVGVHREDAGGIRYYYIRDYDFQIASVGPRTEDVHM